MIAPNGVDLTCYRIVEKTAARQRLGLPKDSLIVLYTGSFQGWKGIETIIQAASDLASYHFYFVGGSEKNLRQLGFEGQISFNVHFAGKRDFKEMPLWHKSADVLLVTGTRKDEYSYYHTSPMKLFEYMAARTPIVASRTPAIEQVVSEREVFFHRPDDSDDLKKIIQFVFNNREEAQKRAQSVYRKAQELSWDSRAKKILGFIKERL